MEKMANSKLNKNMVYFTQMKNQGDETEEEKKQKERYQ